MEVQEQINKFTEFIETFCKEELMENIKKDKKFLYLDVIELSRFAPELTEEVLERPEETIKAAEIAIEGFDTLGEVKGFKARFFNLPLSAKIMIRDIRAKHLNKLMLLEGAVRQKSDVRPQVTSARFECPSCGNIITVLQLDTKFKEPTRCGCGRKGKFRLLDKELVDAQGIVLEESSGDLDGGEQPKRMNLLLKNDLVSPISDKKTNPGSGIRITGILKEVPILAKDGGKSTRFELMIDVNHVETIDEDFSNLEISNEEIEEIIELSRDPKVFEKLLNSVVPSIYGHEKIKEAVLIQMAGGVRKVRDDGSISRGDIHILLIGDPGAGKCLHKDSMVMLNNGEIKRIEELTDNLNYNNKLVNEIEVVNLGFDGKVSNGQAIRVWRRKNKENLLKIKTRLGKEIICTKNHPLFECNNGLIVAKEACKFSTGERIAGPRKIKIKGELQIIKKFFPKYANNSNKLTYPKIVDTNLARLLGYLCGDGYIAYSKTSGWVSLTNNDLDNLEDFSNLMQLLFKAKITKREAHKGKTAKEAYTNSKSLVDFLNENFKEIVENSKNKTIPNKILKSNNNILSHFLKGLFDCDSHVNKNKNQIEYCTISKDLALKVQYCLLRFGIISIFKTKQKCATNTKNKRKINAYEIIISGENIKKYEEQIGYTSKRKKQELQKNLNLKKINNTNIDLIPNIENTLKTIRIRNNLLQKDMGIIRSSYAHYEQQNRLPSHTTVKKIISHLENEIKYREEFETLKTLTNSNVFWDEILSIEEYEDQNYVYDLEVSHTHNYIANGVVVHNSQVLKRIGKIAPKGRFVSGKGASGAGLTAAVVKDEFMSGWSLEAGALVLANRGICCIDELDKMSPDDRDAMHEALEGQTVTISKANIQATLRSETTVLAAANPKFGRFDPYEIIPKQIDLPSTLINRFDLIFPVRDLPDRGKDEKIAKFILSAHQEPESITSEIESNLLRKYFAYARQKVFPELTDGAMEEILKYYLKMRGSGEGEGNVSTIPISARQLEALIRMAEGFAKLELKNKVERKDAKNAIELMHHCLVQIGLDPETGKIDIDRISTGIPATERSHISTIKEIITELEGKLGKTIPMDDIIDIAKEKGIEEDKIEETIQKLKRAGDIFEPRRGFLSKI